MTDSKNILVTGAAGYIGQQLISMLAKDQRITKVIAVDVASNPFSSLPDSVHYIRMDIRDMALRDVMARQNIETVVHLASIVSPGRDMSRAFLHDVEVNGTKNVTRACLQSGVEQLVITSSGAAYGYYKDNPEWLDEYDPIRGNEIFAYSDHKRQIEEHLAELRRSRPQMKQLIFRPGTILGASVHNQITALFEKPVILGVTGSDSPFVFIWDHDVIQALHKGIIEEKQGIYNLAGDGTLTMKEIARRLGKPFISVPASVLTAALWTLSKLGLTRYGPEQIGFLRYRPVLSNRRLKEEFGYIPEKSTEDAFTVYLQP